MKTISKYIKLLFAIAVAFTGFNMASYIYANDGSQINASNYEENRERLEFEANAGNLRKESSSKDYTFGEYGRVHIDAWYVDIVSTEVEADGYHKITFEAKYGFVLPARNTAYATRFINVQSSATQGAKSYTVDEDRKVGTYRFKPTAATNTYAATPILVRLVAIDEQSQQSTFLSDHVFIEVSHAALPFTNEEAAAKVSFQLKGSKTYLVKKNTPLKVYATDNPYFKPIETTPVKTGVHDGSEDFSNRYSILPGSSTDRIGDRLAYDATMFSVSVYDYTAKAWVKKSFHDFYHEDQTIAMPNPTDESLQVPGFRLVGYKIEQLNYKPTMANSFTWDVKQVGFDYELKTNAADYNVQWTSTGVDDTYDQFRESSLRRRAGNVFISGVYVQQCVVRFIDFDGNILKSSTIDKGSDAIAPNDPTRENYDFTGWDKEFTKVQSNLDVYATYKEKAPEKVTVTFVDRDGTVLKVDTILKGGNATAPALPEHEGYRFTGWDKGFTNVQSDCTINATYAKIDTPETELVTVTFVDYDGNILDIQEIEVGTNANAPANPQRDGYTFIGWDKEFTNVQSDLTVTAQYEQRAIVIPPVTPTDPIPPVTPEPPTPVTPPTPETPVARVTPTPVVTNPENTVVNNTTQEPNTTIRDNNTPLGNGDVTMKDNTTPLAGETLGSWALVNLLCAILTILSGIVLLLTKHAKEEDEEKENNYEEENATQYVRRRWTKLATTIVALVSVIAFILTEDMSLPMIMIDQWTLLMLAILVVQLVILIVGRKWKETDNTDENNTTQLHNSTI